MLGFRAADLGLLLKAVRTPEEACRLARVCGYVIMLMGVVVVAVGVFAVDVTTLLEGTLVALLGFAGGWAHSRIAAILLTVLMAFGLATGLAVGAATAGLLIQVALFGVCLRMVEATWRLRRAREPR